jgi:hypothetical protein
MEEMASRYGGYGNILNKKITYQTRDDFQAWDVGVGLKTLRRKPLANKMLNTTLNLDGFMEIHTAERLLPKASSFVVETTIANL